MKANSSHIIESIQVIWDWHLLLIKFLEFILNVFYFLRIFFKLFWSFFHSSLSMNHLIPYLPTQFCVLKQTSKQNPVLKEGQESASKFSGLWAGSLGTGIQREEAAAWEYDRASCTHFNDSEFSGVNIHQWQNIHLRNFKEQTFSLRCRFKILCVWL